jgi:hypothetical protein
VRVQNSSLTASLNTLYGGSNTAVGATLKFSVTANAKLVSSIALFSTGGSLGVVSNQLTATFLVPGTNLGVGLQPFYAIVTSGTGSQYRTATTWINLVGAEPPFGVSAVDPPVTLYWSCTAGRSYQVLTATNPAGPFQMAATYTPSNSAGVWVDTNTEWGEKYYRVQASY